MKETDSKELQRPVNSVQLTNPTGPLLPLIEHELDGSISVTSPKQPALYNSCSSSQA